MNCKRYIYTLLFTVALCCWGKQAQAQSSIPLIGIVEIIGLPPDGDTININETYPIQIYVKNYVPSTSYHGPLSIRYKTNLVDTPSSEIVGENVITLNPNVGQATQLTSNFNPNPQYFIFGGGITTVVVWPQVTAPTNDPIILNYHAIGLVGVNEKKNDGPQLSLFPNPAEDHVTVVLMNTLTTVNRVKIYNLNGQLISDVQESQNDRNYLTVNTADLNAGIYILEAVTKEGVVRRKFVKI